MFTKLTDIKASRTEFLWRPFIPLGLTILEGPPGVLKSTLLCDIAARVSKGRSMPFSTQNDLEGAADVMLFSGEDDPGRIRSLCQDAGADLDRIHVAGRLRIRDEFERIRAAVGEYGVRLIIVDPLSDFLPGLTSDQKARSCLEPLRELAQGQALSVVLVRHLVKSGRNAINAGMGSVSIGGVARSVLLASKHPEAPNTSVLAITKSNVASPKAVSYRLCGQSMSLVWTCESSITSDELLKSIDPVQQTAMEEASDFLFGLLQSGPQLSSDVVALAKRNGIAWTTCKRAKKRLGVRTRRRGSGANQFWVMMLPDQENEAIKAAQARDQDNLMDDLIYGCPIDDRPPVENIQCPENDQVDFDLKDDEGQDDSDAEGEGLQ